METATVNDVVLEFDLVGSGEPVLLVGTGPFADSFVPLFSEDTLRTNYRLIRYRQRDHVSGPGASGPTSFTQHAADAAALLAHLGIERAHVAGHSTGATIALQLAVDSPRAVHSLALLEPPLMSVPAAVGFGEQIAPAIEAFGAGDRPGAMMGFLTVVTGLDWETCREVVEKHVPGAVDRALAGAETFFGSYLPALQNWRFGSREAGRIARPVLSVRGRESHPLFAEGSEVLKSWFPGSAECEIDEVAHLLHMQRPTPVARCLAEFFARHPMAPRDRATGAP